MHFPGRETACLSIHIEGACHNDAIFFIDESGDAGLKGQSSSSSHLVIAMVQMPERTQLLPMVNLRNALNLPQIGWMFKGFTPQKLTMELIVRLTLRSSEPGISNDVVIIEGATPALCRGLRVHFSEEYKRAKRTRPFKNIIGPIRSMKTGCSWLT